MKHKLLGKQYDEGIVWFQKKYPQVMSESWPEEYKPVSLIKKINKFNEMKY